tara:strand:- start:10171 stop:11232 length:1062 start_codon:yes stop_codon:yes gene_type:complete
MAYTFFPKSLDELDRELKANNFSLEGVKEIVSLFSILRSKEIETPINIDLAKKTNVNISRALDGDWTIAQIKLKAGLSKVKVKFGNGSSGNRGANNRGNLFEPQFDAALQSWWAGETVSDNKMLAAIEDLNKTYNISDAKEFKTDILGGENTRRPLVFSPTIQLKNPKGRGYDVGASVTDITVTIDKKPIYLSLKLGGTTTFFNVGVKTILTKKEIENSKITNVNGLKLLKLFGINQQKFCDIFNGTAQGSIDRNPKFNQAAMSTLLQSGIGFNYHIIHKLSGKILSKKMDSAAMVKAAKVSSPVIYYGGKGGKGKRIDIEMQSQTYIFKLNLRDTQGKDGFPTRLMCDFKYR